MIKRKITDPFNVKLQPFDNYGSPIPGMSWHKITYNKKNGFKFKFKKGINYIFVK